MKIAIIGSGISGLTCGYLLHKEHDISVFEASNWVGGAYPYSGCQHQGTYLWD